MLPARSKWTGPPDDQGDAATSAAGPSARADEEVTKVGPVSSRVLSALREIRQRELEETLESAQEHEGAPSGIRHVRCSTTAEQSLVALPSVPDEPGSQIRELLPTEEVLDRWFDDLSEPMIPVELDEIQAGHTSDASAPPTYESVMASLCEAERSVTLIMPNRPMRAPSMPRSAARPPPLSAGPATVAIASSPVSSSKTRVRRTMVVLIVSVVALALSGYSLSDRWSDILGADWLVR